MKFVRKNILEMKGQIVNIEYAGNTLKSVYLQEMELPHTPEETMTIVYITKRGSGVSGFIRGHGLRVECTGEEPLLSKMVRGLDISELAGDQP